MQSCFASLFTDRAIRYRARLGYDQLKAALSAGIMPMVRSDKASSGVIFTLDTESGFRDVIVVSSAYGLGEFYDLQVKERKKAMVGMVGIPSTSLANS